MRHLKLFIGVAQIRKDSDCVLLKSVICPSRQAGLVFSSVIDVGYTRQRNDAGEDVGLDGLFGPFGVSVVLHN